MGLVYASADSSELINALKSNLQSAKETTKQLKTGSQKVVTAVDGKSLAGAAYTAGKGLFSELIIPTIERVTNAFDQLEQELQTYQTADGIIAGEGYLDEDILLRQIEIKKSQRSTALSSVSVLANQVQSITTPEMAETLNSSRKELNNLADDLSEDIRQLEKKIEKLHTFSSSTSSLFSNSLDDLKIAMQGVLVLNNTVVNSDGSYQLPNGIDKSWFTEKKDTSLKEFDALKKKIREEDLPTTKAEILRDYHWSTSANMYVHTKTGKPSPEVTALYNKLVMLEHEPQSDYQLAFYNEMLKTGKHPVTGEPINEAQRANARIMIYVLALQPFVGAWAMSKVPKSYQPSTSSKGSKNGKNYTLNSENSFGEFMSPSEAARYDQYWGRKASQVGTPNSSYFHFREYNGTIEKSKVIYDAFGRQSIRVDFSNHGMPLEHSIPHIHEYLYGPGLSPIKGLEFRYNY